MVARSTPGVERIKAATWETDPFSGKYARSNVDAGTQFPNHQRLFPYPALACLHRGEDSSKVRVGDKPPGATGPPRLGDGNALRPVNRPISAHFHSVGVEFS